MIWGIAPACEAAHARAYYDWLKQGHHGEMNWLQRDPGRRADPRRVVSDGRSVIVVGLNYFTADPDPTIWNDPSRGRIARYAWGPDYHKVMEPMRKTLYAFLKKEEGAAVEGRYYVDTGRFWNARRPPSPAPVLNET